MQQLTFGSLFAGIGGFDLGFQRAGLVCKWQVEKDEFCRKVLAKHWPDVPKYEDVKDCGKHNLKPVDIICGGFPCQPFSHAGKQAGKEDDRYLWPEMFRIVQELKPTWIVGENVPGIVNLALDEVLSDLEGEGYETTTFNLPACSLDAPHKRERIWIVGYFQRSGCKRQSWRRTGSVTENRHMEMETGAFSNSQSDGRRQRNQNGGRAQVAIGEAQQNPQRCSSLPRRLQIGANADQQHGHNGRLRAGEISQQQAPRISISQQWPLEPGICRVANGVPRRVDRLRSLGNAVVPQLTQLIGEMIERASNKGLYTDTGRCPQKLGTS